MARLDLIFIILIYLKIYCVWSDDSDFTKIGRLAEKAYPLKLNDEIKLLSYDSAKLGWFLFSTKHNFEICRFPNVDFIPPLFTLGNEKVVAFGNHLINIIDLSSCSSPVNVTFMLRGDIYANNFGSIITYNNEFDVFDLEQNTCMPCRYTENGEQLYVERLLKREPNRAWTSSWYSRYTVKLIKDAFGRKNGYFYSVNYMNGSTGLKILDSNFNQVKMRILKVNIEAHSVLQENITVCFKFNPCKQNTLLHCSGFENMHDCNLNVFQIFDNKFDHHTCQFVECHLLDSNLNTIAEVKLDEPYKNLWKKNNLVDMKVHNLLGGGAMIAMNFKFDWMSNTSGQQKIFIQRIHPNGRVDSPILYGSFNHGSLSMHDFTFNNGEYCLITLNDYQWAQENRTLVKCLDPSPANYEKLLA